MAVLAIVTAMTRELRDIEKLLSPRKRVAVNPAYIIEGCCSGREVVLTAAGIGRENSQSAIEYLLNTYDAAAIVGIGYAGATVAELKVGDVALYNNVHFLDDQTAEVHHSMPRQSLSSAEQFKALATKALKKAKLSFLEGDAVTVPRLVGHPVEKASLGRELGVIAIDMESYWIAKGALARGVPFLGVRAISDSMHQYTPNLGPILNSHGDAEALTAAMYFFTHPARLPPALRLWMGDRKASRNLSKFVSAFLSLN